MLKKLLPGKRLRRKAPLAFGLDVGSSAVKVVQLARHNGAYGLQGLGIAPLPADAITDGSIKDPAAVIDVLKRYEVVWSETLLQLPHGMAERRRCDTETRCRGSKAALVGHGDECSQVGQVTSIHS